MKGGRRYGIRFLPYTQAAKKAKISFKTIKQTPPSKKIVVFKSPFGRLILGKCGGC